MENSASFRKRNSAQKAPSWYVGRKRGYSRGYRGVWGLGVSLAGWGLGVVFAVHGGCLCLCACLLYLRASVNFPVFPAVSAPAGGPGLSLTWMLLVAEALFHCEIPLDWCPLIIAEQTRTAVLLLKLYSL